MGTNGKGSLSQMEKTPLYTNHAKEVLAKAQGVEFNYLDLSNFFSTYTEGIKQAQSFKQSVESTLYKKILSLI